MAMVQTNNRNTNRATIIKNIKHREKVKNSFKQLCSIAKGTHAGAVSFLKALVPLENTAMYDCMINSLKFHPEWNIIDNDNKVIPQLLLWNNLHLHKA
eukprot:11833529-Ditylum_brightwellii.AAC.1